MSGERKYRQAGYQDSERRNGAPAGEQKPRGTQGPKSLQDPAGPRLPRLVQAVTGSRCFNCATILASNIDFAGTCPRCNAQLHCCKQCAHFEPSTRFQCLKPIPARIPVKDRANECELFSPRVTVSRDASPTAGATPPAVSPMQVRSPQDARAAFDNLFKK